MWTATETLNDSILTQDVGATKVIVDGLLEVKGDGASQDGRIKLNCSQNSHGVTIQSPPHSAGASYTLVLPTSVGTSGQALTTDGSDPAQLSWTTLTAPVTGTGTQNYVTKWSAGGTGIENSTIFDNGTNVGIGTASPAAKLDVAGDILSTGDITIDNSAGDPFLKLKTNAQEYVLRIDQSDGEKFQIRDITNSLTPFTINTAGNVGIGTTSPASVLHVSGGSVTIPTLSTSHPFLISGPNNSGMSIISSTGNAGQIVFGDETDADSGRLRYDHSDNSMRFWTNADERMRIDSSGNVGIGTASPGTRLQVAGTQNVPSGTSKGMLLVRSEVSSHGLQMGVAPSAPWGSWIQAQDNNISTTYPLTLQPGGGNVGIGTTSPAVSLDISATDAVQMPVGVTGDRPTTGVSNGMLRYNSTNNEFEGYINGNWGSIGGGASGGLIFRGTFDASTGAIASGGSLYTCPAGGSGGTVDTAIGDLYIVTTAGSFFCSGTSLNVGDEVICITAATATNDNVNNWNAIASGAGGAVTGSGTTNYVPKFTGATVVGNSSIFNDASGNVGIGTASPGAKLRG